MYVIICSLSDTTIPECVKDAEFPEIGDADRIDVTIRRLFVDDEYVISMRQNGEKFEILEVLLSDFKHRKFIFDYLNWKGTLMFTL